LPIRLDPSFFTLDILILLLNLSNFPAVVTRLAGRLKGFAHALDATLAL